MVSIEADEMKRALRLIARNINTDLFSTLMGYMTISVELRNKFKRPYLFFVDQLLNNDLRPWIIAGWLKTLGHAELAMDFETFAKNYNFPQDTISKGPEIATMQLLKYLKSELTQEELYGMRNTNSETFEEIFRDFVDTLTPSLTELKIKLQDEDREDLSYTVTTNYSPIISTMEPVLFKRTLILCLDTLDVDIFSLLSAIREALSKQYSTYRTLSIHSQKFSLTTDFISLTFTAEVDTRTLPLTEGSDAELLTLMEDAGKHEKKETRYIDAHSEIYSSALNGKLISLIGHPGTGKSFYCSKLVNEFINGDVSYRFVLVIACISVKWHTLEEQCLANPGRESEMLELFLQIIIPSFTNSKEIVRIILNTEGNGLLLVIDSFDEFPQRFEFTATLLYRLLKRQVLTRSTILITSRPGAWNQLLRDYGSEFSFDHSWQLLGFSPEQRDLFITTILSNEKAHICRTFLSTKPELNILSLVPVNISLITSLVDSSTSMTHINTLTDMYKSLVVYTLDKELRRACTKTPGITSLLEMPADMLQIFNRLAELSYHALLARQITFSSIEFPEISTKYTKGLGLFHIIKVITPHKTTIDYLSCPHLTIQEFLSAWHLAQKSPTEIKSIVQQTFSDGTWWPAMKVCVRFLCGILTQGHNTIINIITDNLHRTSAPLLECKYAPFYVDLHYDNTDIHLSVLLYVVETKQPSIITSYYKLLCPDNSTIPHFYLRPDITPIDTYSLTQYISLLPPNSTISALHIDITLLNSIQIDMLASSVNITSIDTLLVRFNPITDISDIQLEKHSSNTTVTKQYRENFMYEIQQLHIQDLHTHYIPTLLAKLGYFSTTLSRYLDNVTFATGKTSNIHNIYALQFAISLLKLPTITVSNSATQTDNIHIQKLFSFIRNITNTSCLYTPKHMCYLFNLVSFMDDNIINSLIDTISSNATYVMLAGFYFTSQFITRLVTSLSKLEYLLIDDDTCKLLRSNFEKPTIDAISFQKLKERNMKGLYLTHVTLMDYILHGYKLTEYLQSQTTLQEIHLHKSTDSKSDTLQAIQHLTSLHYLRIEANDIGEIFYGQHYNSKENMSAYLTILYKNRHTLSYVNFSSYKYFIATCYTVIMRILSQCPNLQYLDLSKCSLTPQHMPTLATTINQLPALLWINIRKNYITDEVIIALATHNTVIRIILSDSRISSAQVIISLINKFPCLQMIELHVNNCLERNALNDTSEDELKAFTKLRKINLTID